jgi:aminoglycoside 6'-N-acetyltransferase
VGRTGGDRSGPTRKAGVQRVGVMRAYERDVDAEGWHDALLMELLADD